MDIRDRIQTFIEVGRILAGFSATAPDGATHLLAEPALQAEERNRWFTQNSIRYALNAIGESMSAGKMERWLDPYMNFLDVKETTGKRIGVVTAGNIPLAGFHDFLTVLISGHTFCGKLSGQDAVLIPAIAGIMENLNPEWKERILFTDEPFRTIDAIIATGSGNTYRYFEYYFARYPHIIRKNRNSIAILNGHETDDENKGLASDVMLYFGLGCRSVSKIYIPASFDIMQLRPFFEPWSSVIRYNKYYNNYEYQKSILIVNRKEFYDFGNILLTGEGRLASPVSVLNFERYSGSGTLSEHLLTQMEQIQCVVSVSCPGLNGLPFGAAQKPDLWDYADGIDTLRFLLVEI
jgi:hypothetical protein